jgi:two-component system cell cycle sensor histidine kinase PleC
VVARTVRDLRERLTSSSGTRPAFDYELALTYAHNRVSTAYALPLLLALVGATSLIWLDAAAVLIWGGAASALHLISLILCTRFLDHPAADTKVRRLRIFCRNNNMAG